MNRANVYWQYKRGLPLDQSYDVEVMFDAPLKNFLCDISEGGGVLPEPRSVDEAGMVKRVGFS